MDKISVFIVDRQTLYREGVRQALSANESMSVVGDSAPSGEALTLVEAFAPNVVLVDVDLPLLRGLDLARQITTRCPQTAVTSMPRSTMASASSVRSVPVETVSG